MLKDKSTKEIGFVVNAKGYLLSLDGLPSARVNDILVDDSGGKAIVVSLEEDAISALLLTDTLSKAGDRFFLSGTNLQYSMGDHLFGRVINILGDPIDKKGAFPKINATLKFEPKAMGISKRKEITDQFETGISVIDVLYPIGKGQRQLLFGPTSCGKTTFIQDIIVNQKGKGVICIYVGIGKSGAAIERFATRVFNKGAKDYTIVVAALAEEQTSISVIAPTVGLFLAEYFCRQGKEVLLIIDDLGVHAKYAREVALLMSRIPGRQSYPGDIFYQHAHLLELAGSFSDEAGGGSITLLPILETDIENFTELIPTNVMSMTDGHLFFSPDLHAEGYYPSIAIDKSVTRVGKQTQRQIQKELSTRIMMLFTEFKKQEEYSRFGTNLSNRTRNILRQGELTLELLKQVSFENLNQSTQISLLSLVFTSFLAKKERPFLAKNKEKIIEALVGDTRLEDVRSMLMDDEVTFGDFIKHLDSKSNVFDSVCHR